MLELSVNGILLKNSQRKPWVFFYVFVSRTIFVAYETIDVTIEETIEVTIEETIEVTIEETIDVTIEETIDNCS